MRTGFFSIIPVLVAAGLISKSPASFVTHILQAVVFLKAVTSYFVFVPAGGIVAIVQSAAMDDYGASVGDGEAQALGGLVIREEWDFGVNIAGHTLEEHNRG
jgi:hypothetical protein